MTLIIYYCVGVKDFVTIYYCVGVQEFVIVNNCVGGKIPCHNLLLSTVENTVVGRWGFFNFTFKFRKQSRESARADWLKTVFV